MKTKIEKYLKQSINDKCKWEVKEEIHNFIINLEHSTLDLKTSFLLSKDLMSSSNKGIFIVEFEISTYIKEFEKYVCSAVSIIKNY